jgi:putative tricarboxylic transport membrane protein
VSLLLGGFEHLFTGGGALALLAGVFLGIIVGSLPGLTATMGIALLIPFTFGVAPEIALSMMIGIFAGGIYGGSISAILLRTPGTPAAGATVLDGYPLAQRGEAGRALAVATISSAVGGFIGAVILSFLAPQIARIAVQFGPPEYVLLGIYGLTMISYVTGKSMLKGYFMGLLGLLIATIGIDPISGFPRFYFGNLNLLTGIALLPALIGLFAVAQAFEGVATFRGLVIPQVKIARIGISIRDFVRIIPHVVKSALIGTFVGAVPGTGTDIAAFLSYGEAKRSSRNAAEFGTGAIEGVAAPEAGNNASVNGAMIPLFTLPPRLLHSTDQRLRAHHGPQSLQRVEDQVEPHLELGAPPRGVVARGDEFGGGLVEVGVAVGGDLGEEDLLGHVGELFLGVEGQGRDLQREAVEVAVQEPVGVGGRDDGEAGAAKDREQRLAVLEVRRSRLRS